MIDVVDYNAGNMLSLYRALDYLQVPFNIVTKYQHITSKVLMIPGVGSFSSASSLLQNNGFGQLKKTNTYERPFVIGICLGMQLLFSNGYEGGESKGLELLSGDVIKITKDKTEISSTLIGWENYIISKKGISNLSWIEKFNDSSYYHLHSYMCLPKKSENIIATYPDKLSFIPTIVGSQEERVIGFQFHPEKSGFAGLKLLRSTINYAFTA